MTFFVLKLDKSKEVKRKHFANIYSIISTLPVFRLDKFFIDVNAEHPLNILFIAVTPEESNSDKSISLIFSHPANKQIVFFTLLYQNIFITVFVSLIKILC